MRKYRVVRVLNTPVLGVFEKHYEIHRLYGIWGLEICRTIKDKSEPRKFVSFEDAEAWLKNHDSTAITERCEYITGWAS